MDKQKTLILIDGHALAFRQYYALERTGMHTSDGVPSWAVYGFFKAIFDLLKKQKPEAIGVAFDVSHQTFRVDKYSEYKANRVSMPDDMSCQMQYIFEGLKAFNIPVYTKEGYEADDVIGTISKKACELGHKVLILTGDQDSFQLVDKEGCTKVIIPSKGELLEYDWNKVYEKLGVYPNQVIDYKSLRGDTSDNIPGIKGIGEKTAVKLLAEYGTLDNVLANCENIKPDGLKQKICNDIEIAKLSYFLATIVRDVDISFDFASTNVELPDIKAVTEFLKQMQFYTFLKNIDSILSLFDLSDSTNNIDNIEIVQKPVEASVSFDNMQLGLFLNSIRNEVNKIQYHSVQKLITNVDDLNNLCQVLFQKTLITIHSEATIADSVSSTIYGVGIAYCDAFSSNKVINHNNKDEIYYTYYIPFNRDIKNEQIFAALSLVLSNDKIKKIVYDAKNEYNIWNSNGLEFNGIIFDVLLSSYVHDMSRNHTLSVQALENISHVTNDVVNANYSVNDIDINSALLYETDILVTIFELTKYWIKNLNDKELNLLYKIEVPMALVLADMQAMGVSLDTDYLLQLSNDMESKISEYQENVYELAGESFNINSPKQVGEILFNKLQLVGKKKKNKFSTSAEVLEELSENNEIAKFILEYRKYSKLKSTYTDALPELISKYDNRIHTTYNQTITVTGRLSSSNPNLQNIPVRSEYGSKIRRAFVPQDKENAVILSADYSQIELRLLAHISQDKNLISAFLSNEDVHSITASKVFGVSLNEVTKQMRSKAKTVNFGIVYGQSKYGLAKSLGISADEAEQFIFKYFATYPLIKEYMELQVIKAQQQGYVETLFGRKRYLQNELNSSNGMIREFAKRAAINYPMQGSASDLIKIAMIDFVAKLKENNLKSKLIIQVHDELVVETFKDELEQIKNIVKSSMELNQPLAVPLLVDINVGETWQEN